MPGAASSNRTQTNAKKLAAALGLTYEQRSIRDLTNIMLNTLDHDGQQDITYENTQARARTSILFNRANQLHGLVVGTGDLSEIALGWCTFNGDHISHYNVNASIPKTLVRHMVTWISDLADYETAKKVLKDIVSTPISPELVSQKDGKISQKTEDIIGPYVLHDFFLYHFRRWGDFQEKILYLAIKAFDGIYSKTEVEKWLEVFMTRFYANQWKRNVMPDGPKVGTVSLSPRGDLRMAPDTKRPVKFIKDL
jgi:NAD+ synthase (glutamine-hydrolysing)